MRARPSHERRGAAMPLVIISLGMATVLTTAFIAARDNSALLGENAAVSSTARWSATAGLDLGIAILETEADWRNQHTNGQLLSGYMLDGAEIDIELIDLETGGPPTDGSSEIEMHASATVGGLTQTVVAHAQVATDELDSVDVDLSEFAVFGEDEIKLEDDATLARWPEAPSAGLGERLALGTRATALGKVDFAGASAGIDSTVYHGPTASDSLITIASGPEVQEVALLDQIPVPAPPSSGAGDPVGGQADLSVSETQALTGDHRYSAVTMDTESTLTLSGNTTIVAEGNFVVGRGATLSIDGDVNLVVYGNITVNKGIIELEPNATLTIYADHNVDIINAYAGNVRPLGEDRDNTGHASYMDVERFQIFDIPGGNSGTWKLSMQSVAKASMYNTEGDIEIRDSSAVYGRVLGKRVRLRGLAVLFYDHALDDNNGYTNPNSLAFENDQTINDDLLSLTTLDDSDLEILSDSIGVKVRSGKTVFGADSATAPPEESSGPTPRPVPVEWKIISYGMDMTTWEQ